jgi:hypothetical protein
VVGRQPYAPAAFTPGEIPGTHFQRLSRPQGTWFCRKEQRKKSQVTPPGIDPGTVRIVAQRFTVGTGFESINPAKNYSHLLYANNLIVFRNVSCSFSVSALLV